MRFGSVALAILIVWAATAHAEISMQEVVYDIQSDGSVRQITTIYFDTPTNGSLTYILNEDHYEVSISDGTRSVPFTIEVDSGNLIIKIDVEHPTQLLRIFSLTRSLVFEGGSTRHFFAEMNSNGVPFAVVQTYLPRGYGLVGDSYKPSNTTINSDGQRIFLTWNVDEPEQSFFSVKYTDMAAKESGLYMTVILLLIVGMIFLMVHFHKRNFEVLLSGFRDDEKKTMLLVKEKGTLLQSDLQKQFGFSRAKATRIVMHLESKGLVTKQRYGRTNKIVWKEK